MDTISIQNKTKLARETIVSLAHHCKSAHVGSALSCIDILMTLYTTFLRTGIDHFIMSKGHGCMAYYTAMEQIGIMSTETLLSYHTNGGKLLGHPSHSVPGIDWSTGSLGHGLSVAVGFAMAQKIKGIKANNFVLLGDGECNEGSVWEAAMLASKQKLDNVIAIIDHNGLQATNKCAEIDVGNFINKWVSFGWNVVVVDGNNIKDLCQVFSDTILYINCPTVIIANTIKGKGVSFMENNIEWHYKYPSQMELDMAVKEIRGK